MAKQNGERELGRRGRRRREQRCVRGVRWRARRAALKADQGAARGLVASVARGNEGWPRSAARQGTAGPFGRHGGEAARRRALVAACASTGRARRGRRARSSGVGRQRRGTARQQGSERGQAAAQHGSERTRAVLECLRAQRGESQRGIERKEREREWRERKKVHGLT